MRVWERQHCSPRTISGATAPDVPWPGPGCPPSRQSGRALEMLGDGRSIRLCTWTAGTAPAAGCGDGIRGDGPRPDRPGSSSEHGWGCGTPPARAREDLDLAEAETGCRGEDRRRRRPPAAAPGGARSRPGHVRDARACITCRASPHRGGAGGKERRGHGQRPPYALPPSSCDALKQPHPERSRVPPRDSGPATVWTLFCVPVACVLTEKRRSDPLRPHPPPVSWRVSHPSIVRESRHDGPQTKKKRNRPG